MIHNITHGQPQLDNIVRQHGAESVFLLDFYAQWCGPCRMLAPKVQQLAETYSPRLVLCKIDVDLPGNRSLMDDFQVKAMPTLVWVRDKQILSTLTGANEGELKRRTAQIMRQG